MLFIEAALYIGCQSRQGTLKKFFSHENHYYPSSSSKYQKQPFGDVLIKRCSKNMQQIYSRTPMPKCDFNKVAKQVSALVFSCKFAVYFQNIFSQEHLWRAGSKFISFRCHHFQLTAYCDILMFLSSILDC